MTEALIIGGALAFGGLLLWALSRASKAQGAAEERAAQTQDAINEIRKANDAIASVDALSADDRRRRMSAWSRD